MAFMLRKDKLQLRMLQTRLGRLRRWGQSRGVDDGAAGAAGGGDIKGVRLGRMRRWGEVGGGDDGGYIDGPRTSEYYSVTFYRASYTGQIQ